MPPRCSFLPRSPSRLAPRASRLIARFSPLTRSLFPHIPFFVLPLTLVLLASRVAHADDAQQFELAKTRFDAGQLDEAADRLTTMLSPQNAPCDPLDTSNKPCRITDPALIERARSYAAAALIALKRPDDADVHIEAILLNNPSFTPNPAIFQNDVIDRFTAVRTRIRLQIEAAAKKKEEEQRAARLAAQKARDEERRWIADLQKLASNQVTIKQNSRLIALIPFGVGQFQNGDNAFGWFFLISQTLAGATSLISFAVLDGYTGVDTSPPAGQPEVIISELNARIDVAAAVNRISFGAWLTLTIGGIIHAQVTFVPERAQTRTRPIPSPPPSFHAQPTITMLPGGAGFGVVGRF